MLLDTPATIAIHGSGPVGLEAALYARFLGYQVILVGERSLADLLADAKTGELDLVLSDLSSTLGRAALAAHDEEQPISLETPITSLLQWHSSYLGPLLETDLLVDQQRWQVAIQNVTASAEGLLVAAREGDESITVDAIIDSGGEFPETDHLHYLPEVALQGITPAALKDSFRTGLVAIRELFALLGGRHDLDLYDSVGYLPGAGDAT